MKIEQWKDVKLSEIADIYDNLRVPLSSEVRSGRKGLYPYCGANGIVDYIDDWKFEGEHVLIAEDGGNFHDFKTRPITYIMDGKFWVNNHAHVLKAKNGANRFLHYSLQHKDITKYIIGSTRTKLNKSALEAIILLIPPLPEQQKITEILSTVDDKIEVIDQQIIETQALKKGLMQRLFTKGIGHTEFKDSPLGMIPESWEVLEFGDLISSHCYGPRFSSKDYSESGNVKTIRGTDINKTGDILYQQVPTAKLPNDFVENHKLKDGDLVMITTADCGLTGVYFDQGFPFIPSAYAVRIRLNEKAYPFYFKFMFQTELAKNQVEKYIRKGTVANLPGSDILKFTFPTPPIEEQQKIAEILSSVDDKLNVLLEKKTHYQELKQGLMQQLLTGKIRVKV